MQNLQLEKYFHNLESPQVISSKIEVTLSDISNMKLIRESVGDSRNQYGKDFQSNPWQVAKNWTPEDFEAGQEIVFEWTDGNKTSQNSALENQYLQYANLYEADNFLRDQADLSSLNIPIIYLPTNRAQQGFPESVGLSNFDYLNLRQGVDISSSRHTPAFINLALNRFARTFRMLHEVANSNPIEEFHKDLTVQRLTEELRKLGYGWSIETRDPLKNEYAFLLEKQGRYFNAANMSSGEREILSYLFAIFALNIRDSLIVVDEPELHLHPRWQKVLLGMFRNLAKSTGNQFVLATHAPSLVQPESIGFVTRVFSRDQVSCIKKIETETLPNAKHLAHIVNTQNNEKVFFADRVVLVEGVSDRIVFQRILEMSHKDDLLTRNIEIVDVGGKGLFGAYASLLEAASVPYSIVADFDYLVEQGNERVKSFFSPSPKRIKDDVLANPTSTDANSLFQMMEDSLSTGDLSGVSQLWGYIKNRKSALSRELDEEERSDLDVCLNGLKAKLIFVLPNGCLEDYLPVGQQSKNLENLITFVESDEFTQCYRDGLFADLEDLLIEASGFNS